MNRRFAVDPAAFEAASDVTVLQQFGFCEGRFIVQFPKSWKSEFHQAIAKLPDGLSKIAALELFRKLQEMGGLIPSFGLPYDPRTCWVENALAHASRFDAIISANQSKHGADNLLPMSDAVFKLKSLFPAKATRFPSTIAGYLSAAELLLQISEEICFVDPYFSFYKRSKAEVVAALVERAARERARSFLIYMSAKDRSIGDVSRYISEELDEDVRRFVETLKLPTCAIEITVIFVDDHDAESRFHSRYLLSKYGGLNFDYGFDLGRKGDKKEKVAVLSWEEHRLCFDEYIERQHTFTELVRRRYIVGGIKNDC